MLNRFIVTWITDADDARLIGELTNTGLQVDQNYGVVTVDPIGPVKVVRVMSTADAIERASKVLSFRYVPDMIVGPRR